LQPQFALGEQDNVVCGDQSGLLNWKCEEENEKEKKKAYQWNDFMGGTRLTRLA